tara:strand:+ start:72 stop:518 length:447 start_codon:yes stop_codon:yes gene_type:complete
LSKNKSKLIGYVTNNEFNEKIIPIPFQNTILRNYCQDNNYVYLLPYNEMIFKNSYSQLITMINKIDKNTAIICCSIFMLPEKIFYLKKIIQALNQKNTYIYSLYEDIYVQNVKDIETIDYNKKIIKLNKNFFSDKKFKAYLNKLLHKV